MSEYIAKCTEVIGISGKPINVPDYIDLNSEIVRCRDCKYSCNWNRISLIPWCWCHEVEIDPDGYCWKAERRES